VASSKPLYRRALAISEKSLEPNHSDVAIRLNNLAGLLLATSRLSEAKPLSRRAVTIMENSLGADHPNTIIMRKNYEILLKELAAK
jgi:hypothetical protein